MSDPKGEWNALEAERRTLRAIQSLAVARNLPGIRALTERRMAAITKAQVALFSPTHQPLAND